MEARERRAREQPRSVCLCVRERERERERERGREGGRERACARERTGEKNQTKLHWTTIVRHTTRGMTRGLEPVDHERDRERERDSDRERPRANARVSEHGGQASAAGRRSHGRAGETAACCESRPFTRGLWVRSTPSRHRPKPTKAPSAVDLVVVHDAVLRTPAG